MIEKPFEFIQSITRQHRADHGCGAYTFEDGLSAGAWRSQKNGGSP
jgi:hypothetical protein